MHALASDWNLVTQDGARPKWLVSNGFVSLCKKTGYTGRATPRQDFNSNPDRGKK